MSLLNSLTDSTMDDSTIIVIIAAFEALTVFVTRSNELRVYDGPGPSGNRFGYAYLELRRI